MLQSLPLDVKVEKSKIRTREFIEQFPDFYVSFSGGKDSEVAVDLAAQCCLDLGISKLHVLNINTGLEYMSVHEFCKPFCRHISQKYDLEVILDVKIPNVCFADTLRTYGYPLFSKEVSQCIEDARAGLQKGDGTYQYALDRLNGVWTDRNGRLSYNKEKYRFLLDAPFRISRLCCSKQKKEPAFLYEKETGRVPLLATTAAESQLRRTNWMLHGCNTFTGKRPKSAPLSFWTHNDFLLYIKRANLPMADAYGEIVYTDCSKTKCQTTGCSRTGCLFCLFGITQDTFRILRLQKLEPHRTDYVLRGGEFDSAGYWIPNQEGLGYWFILDYLASHGYDIPYIDRGYRKNNVTIPCSSPYRQIWLFDLLGSDGLTY